jgi:ribosomal protein S27E
MTIKALWRWATTGRRLHELTCPGCWVTNVVLSRVGDELKCGICGRRFWHGKHHTVTSK